jgi:nucleotide-binding universal stress UspA family protein
MLPLKKIVCPTDFSEPAYKGLKIAAELAAEFSAELLLVHVVSPLPTMPGGIGPAGFQFPSVLDEIQETARNSLEEIRRDKIAADVRVRTVVKYGSPAHEIVKLAESETADMIVISSHGESGWHRFVFGSVAEKVVRHAECPVLTIRASKEDSQVSAEP